MGSDSPSGKNGMSCSCTSGLDKMGAMASEVRTLARSTVANRGEIEVQKIGEKQNGKGLKIFG